MKLLRRSFFAVSAITTALGLTLAGAASAQTANVTLYGRIDINLTKLRGQPLIMTQSSTSRWGLRGSESLGGGWNAIFQMESAFNPDTGSLSGSGLFSRESWVGVSNAGFGTLRLGRTLTPSQRIASNFDPHGTDGIGSFGSGGLLLGHSPLARFNNGIYYETPNLSGFTLFGGYQVDEVKDATDESIFSIRARYQAGGFDLALAHANLSTGNKVNSIAAAYNLKFIKPMIQYHDGKRGNADRVHWLAGFTAPLGAGEVRAAVSEQNDKSAKNIDRRLIALGYDYSLSKRTLIYATLINDKTTGVKGVNGAELGLRHSF
jgi:predicted porin